MSRKAWMRHMLIGAQILGICLIWIWSILLHGSHYSESERRVGHQNPFLNINTDVKSRADLNDRRSYHGNPCDTGKTASQTQTSKCAHEVNARMLTGDITGRLGNQLFYYAILTGIANYNNRSAFMSPLMSGYLSKFFDIPIKTIPTALDQQIKWKKVPIRNRNVSELKFKKELRAPHVKLTEFTQVWKYFDYMRPTIRQHLKFYGDIIERAKRMLEIAKSEFDEPRDPPRKFTFVGVHVRRGDYPDYEDSWKFSMPTTQFYEGAMKYFSDRYQNVIFVVSTNENDTWCKTNFFRSRKKFRIHYLNGALEDEGGLDMAVLAQCDHVIFGIGTFGWWAGYLNPGEVIYCSDCNGPHTAAMAIWADDYANFVLPEWIGFSLGGTKTDRNSLPKRIL